MRLLAKTGSVYFRGRFYGVGEDIPADLDQVKSLVADGIVEVVEEPAHEPEPAPVVEEAPVAPAEEPPSEEAAEEPPPTIKKPAQRKPRVKKSEEE